MRDLRVQDGMEVSSCLPVVCRCVPVGFCDSGYFRVGNKLYSTQEYYIFVQRVAELCSLYVLLTQKSILTP